MITLESIMSIPKSNLQETSKTFGKEDIPQLIEWLTLKDDNSRYQVFPLNLWLLKKPCKNLYYLIS